MKKVLVIEDDAFLLSVYQAKMQQVQLDFRIAKDGEQAFSLLNEFQPDLIVLDLMIPKESGFDVLKKLKSEPKWQNIPVLVVSNLSQDEEKEKAKKLGAVDFFVKSEVNMQEIIQRVEQLLGE